MKYKSRLTKRIVIAFFIMTLTISSLFTLGITTVIRKVEQYLVTAELEREIGHLIDAWRQGFRIRLDADTLLYTTEDANLPTYLQSLKEGYTEVVMTNRAIYVLKKTIGEKTFYLVKDQSEFENQENLIKLTIFGGFVGSIIFSLLLGLALARTIIAPVRRLTEQVHNKEYPNDTTVNIAGDYADDEVGELASVLDDTINHLQRARMRESYFISDISHELRTPLMVIRSSAELMREKQHYSEKNLNTIISASTEIEELTETFLCLARGKVSTATAMLSIHTILKEQINFWEQEVVSKGLDFHYEEADTNHAFFERVFPAILIKTIVNNLMRNALHYTSQGLIHIKLTPGRLQICDSGSGIPEKDKAMVFAAFYQGEHHNPSGVGLGLSIVQRICEKLGWQAEVTDNFPQGTCFSILFNEEC